MNTFVNSLGSGYGYSRTENGALTLSSSSNPLVDLFFAIGASRGRNIVNTFTNAFSYDAEKAMRILLWARDVREGAGERKQFRDLLVSCYNQPAFLEVIKSGIIQEVGRWDDYWHVIETIRNPEIDALVCEQVRAGALAKNGLLGKWLPRKGYVASVIRKYFGLRAKEYRRMCVDLSNTVEQKMCARKWEEIIYNHVPSQASKIYQKAFLRHDGERYQSWLDSLKRKDGTAKVNAGAIHPHEILFKYYGDAGLLQAQWDALPNFLKDGESILPVSDVSPSMESRVGNGSTTCMHVSIALGIYIAERQKGAFKDLICTFHDKPTLSNISHLTNVIAKRDYVSRSPWGGSTNLQATFDLILSHATRNCVPQEDMPKTILIMSDMEFNTACHGADGRKITNLDAIRLKYKNAGYEMPKVVFWNIQARGEDRNVPATSLDPGIGLVSGFSPSIMKSILGANDFTPYGIMMATIMKDRYNYRR